MWRNFVADDCFTASSVVLLNADLRVLFFDFMTYIPH